MDKAATIGLYDAPWPAVEMTRRFAHAFRKCCRACLLVGVSLETFGHDASAETIAHLTRTVWGCVDPNVAPSINDASNPSHLDPQWVIRTVAEGKCVTLTPGGKWATLSHERPFRFVLGTYCSIGGRSSFGTSNSAAIASRNEDSTNRNVCLSEAKASGCGTFRPSV